ncbi:L-threonylcarbamoyladenylate synthase [Thermodesulforhabdus norvegica]|uniref:L-threonylcarbamoyladenylate synthase n=1 Tax=Thermodesulforhabdus norvegica TaxID=39841 RepID=A0A1I4UYD5_9BACT|nr:L-threonylcarbamoyladenylate synthase [Thermodesulforhabdus norvegica]SFM93994.1 translation factor SUA5 [Thermodesulforhabdus norvegica]
MKQAKPFFRRYWRVDLPYEQHVVRYGEEWKKLVEAGAVFVYPTETVYGIGCNPFNEESVRRIFRVKGRPESRPLLLVAENISSARRAFRKWPECAEAIASKFWPGAVTVILPAAASIPDVVHAGTGNVAVRVSPHPIARFLASAAKGLFVSTSANLSDRPPIGSPSELSESMIEVIDAVIDAGPLDNSLTSTIIDCSEGFPRLIRKGAVPFSEILRSTGTEL